MPVDEQEDDGGGNREHRGVQVAALPEGGKDDQSVGDAVLRANAR